MQHHRRRALAAGLAGALAKKQPLWREPDTAPPARASIAVSPDTAPTARVYVLTDWGCASACLDAVDLWTALGNGIERTSM